jgi:hypothetical protein
VFHRANGERYEGEFKDGKRHGVSVSYVPTNEEVPLAALPTPTPHAITLLGALTLVRVRCVACPGQGKGLPRGVGGRLAHLQI